MSQCYLSLSENYRFDIAVPRYLFSDLKIILSQNTKDLFIVIAQCKDYKHWKCETIIQRKRLGQQGWQESWDTKKNTYLLVKRQ